VIHDVCRPLNAEKELIRSFDPLNRGLYNSAEMVFSGRQKNENELTQFYVPLNRGFYESTSIEISGRQNAHKKLCVSRPSKIRIFRPTNARNEVTRS